MPTVGVVRGFTIAAFCGSLAWKACATKASDIADVDGLMRRGEELSVQVGHHGDLLMRDPSGAPRAVRKGGIAYSKSKLMRRLTRRSHHVSVDIRAAAAWAADHLDHALEEAEEARVRARSTEEAASIQILAQEDNSIIQQTGQSAVAGCPADAEDKMLLKDVSSLASMRGQIGRPTKKLTIGCMMYTYHGKRQRLLDQITTWARDCDKVYAFSDETWKVPKLNFSTIEVHPDTDGETYSNLWRKTQQMWSKMAELWPRDKLDFLLVGGDDMFFIMPNVRAFLEDKSTTVPNVLGQVQGSFVSGAGYIVNKGVADIMPTCVGEAWNKKTAAEDVMLGECLRSNGVDHPSSLTQSFSNLFCAFGICRTSPDTLLYHYIAGKNQWDIFNAIYGDSEETRSPRICAPTPGAAA